MSMYQGTVMRSTWALALALLLVTAAAQTLTPTNWTSGTQAQQQNDSISVLIAQADGEDQYFVPVLPLTSGATSNLGSDGRQGSIYLVTEDNTIDSNYLDLQYDDIAIMSCDPYNGELQAATVLNQLLTVNEQPMFILLYSEASDYCNLTSYSGDNPYIYSTKTRINATNLLANINANPSSLDGIVASTSALQTALARGTVYTPKPPNTAPAMIVLYAITAVVAALFIAIIVTGAVRAHRHPERYGPRLIVGRTRQGRAKGLARAMLDTLPIVKFGEREGHQPKAVDIELAENESRSASTAGGGAEQEERPASPAAVANTADNESTSQPSSSHPSNKAKEFLEAQESGIGSATEPGPSARDVSDIVPSQSECAICAEDFEAGQDQRVLPCNHRFHPGCIDPWLLNVSGTCPLCRIDLRPAGDAAAAEDEGDEAGRQVDENGNPIPRHSELPPPIAPQNDPQRISVARALLLTLTHPGGPSRAQTEERLNWQERMEMRRQLEVRRQLEERRQLALRVARVRSEGQAGAGAPQTAETEEEQVRNRSRVMNFLRRARVGRQQPDEPTHVMLRISGSSTPRERQS